MSLKHTRKQNVGRESTSLKISGRVDLWLCSSSVCHVLALQCVLSLSSVCSTSSASSLASNNSWYSTVPRQLELESPLYLRLPFLSAHMYPHLLFPGSNPACSMFLRDVSCVCCFSWPSLPICSPCLLVSLLVCTQCSSSHFMASSPFCETRCPLSWAPSSLWSVQHRLPHKYTYIKIRRSDLLVRESMQYLALWTWVTSLSTVSPTCIHFPQVSWLQQKFSAFLTPRHFNAAPHVVVAPTIELFHYCFITVILLLLWIMM